MKIDTSTAKHTLIGHGWELSKDGSRVVLGVGNLPGRKQACLYVQKVERGSCVSYPLAYFTDKDAAKEALDIIDSIAMAKG